jgi:YD repeat-containing protein
MELQTESFPLRFESELIEKSLPGYLIHIVYAPVHAATAWSHAPITSTLGLLFGLEDSMQIKSLAKVVTLALAVLILLAISPAGFGQNAYTPDVGNVGLPDNGTFHGSNIDTVQLNNGNLHIDIPLLHLPGIGLDTDIHLTYDSQVWNRVQGPTTPGSPYEWTLISWNRPPWQTKDPMAGFLKWGQHTLQWNCQLINGGLGEGAGSNIDIDFMSFTDQDGTAHSLPVSGMLPSGTEQLCNVNGVVGGWPTLDTTNDAFNGYYPVYSSDQSGYRLVVNSSGNVMSFADKHGTKYTFTSQPSGSFSGLPAPLASTPNVCTGSACGATLNPGGATQVEYEQVTSIEDSNGNKISSSSNSSSMTITDTVDRNITENFLPYFYSPQPAKCGNSIPESADVLPVPSASVGNTLSTIQYTDTNGQETITVCYGLATVSLNLFCGTSVNCGSVTQTGFASGSIVVPTSIILQNGDTYTFSYNSNGDPNYLGEITSITLPTGGTISYTYGDYLTIPFSGRQLLSRTVTENGQSSTWNYNYAYNSLLVGGGGQPNTGLLTVTVTDPYSNDTVYTCNSNPTNLSNIPALSSPPPCYMANEVTYNGRASSQNPIATKATGYSLIGPVLMPSSEILTWNSSGATTETDTTWDTFTPTTRNELSNPGLGVGSLYTTLGNMMSKTVYDYGSGAHGALLSNTQYSYLHQGNSAYVAPNILDRQTQVSVYNSLTASSSTLVAQTTTGYDVFGQTAQNGLASASNTQHDASYGIGYSTRGLPTSVTKYTGPSTAAIISYTNYNILGKPTITTDALGNSTTYAYGTQGAYLTSTTMPPTNGVAHVIAESHDVNTGLLLWKKDQNGNQTTYNSYDSLMRPLFVTRPPNMGSNLGGGTTNYAYPDPNHVNTVTTLDASRSTTTIVTVDGIGRKTSTNSTSDAICGPLTVDTSYDLMGRVQSVSNQHCGSSLSTDGYTSYTYDAASRLTNKRNPDGSSQNWSFNGNIITFTDETGRQWQHTYDAEDRLTTVLEPNGTSAIGAPSLETDYSYDALGNLLRVDQWGGANGSANDHVRVFAYDGMSRLLASNNPESASAANPAAQSCSGTTSGTYWTTCYSYDNNSNLYTKTDNRGITITYLYDALNRIIGKTYTDSTPAVAFAYDTSSITNSSNDIGELTQATVKTGSTTLAQTNTYGYDSMGRLLFEQQCTPATNCASSPYQLGYTYDYAGKPLSGTFPSNVGVTGQPLLLTYTYDSAERLLTASSNWASDTKHPGTLFQASTNSSLPAYGPMGLQNAELGINSTAGTTTANMQRAYDNRSRIANGIYTAGASPVAGSASTGTITLAGTEGQVTKASTAGSATISFSLTNYGNNTPICGEVQVYVGGTVGYVWEYECYGTQYASGSISVTVQSDPAFTSTAGWSGSATSTPASVMASTATALAAGFNIAGSPVTAVANANGTVTITANTTGVGTNYPVTVTTNW